MVVKFFVGGFLFLGVIGNVEIMDSVVLGGLGGIYSGLLVVCVVVFVVLDVIEEEGLNNCVCVLGD